METMNYVVYNKKEKRNDWAYFKKENALARAKKLNAEFFINTPIDTVEIIPATTDWIVKKIK